MWTILPFLKLDEFESTSKLVRPKLYETFNPKKCKELRVNFRRDMPGLAQLTFDGAPLETTAINCYVFKSKMTLKK